METFEIFGDELTIRGKAADRIVPDSIIFPLSKATAQSRVFKSRKGGFLLSPEGTWFQSKQFSIDYTFDPAEWQGPRPEYEPELLPRTLDLLRKKKSIRVVAYGDSITVGANATGLSGMPPYQWTWNQLIVNVLSDRFDTEIELVNAAYGGTTAEWGAENASHLVAPLRPDLVILAFGMNGAIKPQDFGKMTESMMEDIRSVNPSAEFILVFGMQANSNWRSLEPQRSYGPVLEALEEPGVLFADVWSMHGALLDRKRYFDLTANHVNHPSDFLIRVYAQVVLSRILSFE